MAEAPNQSATFLGSLVNAGHAQSEAIAINDFIFMSQDISNCFLVTTRDGDVMINAGTRRGAERHKQLFAPHRKGPLRTIVITQSMSDHFGGCATLRESGTKLLAHRLFPDTCDFYQRMEPFFQPRTMKLWGSVLKQAASMVDDMVAADILADDNYAFEVGERRFEILSTPEGETVDGISVWMPKEKVVFTGNLFGPVFMSMPFLVTVRGDRPRRVRHYLQSLERVRALKPDLMITGHGEPIVGAAKIQADLAKLRDAVKYVSDATEAGMNAGKDVHTLMREIKLPPQLAIGEFHGKVSWAVRSIFDELTGWFHYDSTTSLYGVPRKSIDSDLVALAGGADKLAARARQRLEANEPLEAMHLIDIALGAAPDDRAALLVKKDALNKLLLDSGSVNLSETMWLKSEIADVEKALA